MARELNLVEAHNLQTIIHRRVQGAGLRLIMDPEATTACTGTGAVVIPEFKMPMTDEQAELTYGYVVHECGHHSRPEAFDILRNAKLEPGSPMHSLFNIIEDEAMEREVQARFPGDSKALSASMEHHIKRQLVANAEAFKHPEKWDDDAIKSTAVYLLSLSARSDWDIRSRKSAMAYLHQVSADARDLVSELSSTGEGWIKRFREPKDPSGSWDLAIDLYKRLYPNAPEDELEELRQRGLGQQEVGEDTAGGGAGGDNVEEGHGERKKGVASHAETKQEGLLIPWDQLVHSEHENNHVGTCGIDWTGHKDSERLGIAPPDKIKVVVCEEAYPAYTDNGDRQSNALAASVRQYLQAMARIKHRPDREHGNLNRQAISRLLMPPVDKGRWNRKVFYTKTKKEHMNTCIGILVDWSGSMTGSKKEYASAATERMYQVFGRVLNVPTYIAAFSDLQSACDIGIIKNWNERTLVGNQIGARFKYFDKHTSANNDSDALLWMYRLLRERKEERKILLVLSDGSPAGAYKGHSSTNLKHVTKIIEQDPSVHLMGLGLCSNKVENYYRKHKVIRDPEDINSAIFNLLKEAYTDVS